MYGGLKLGRAQLQLTQAAFHDGIHSTRLRNGERSVRDAKLA